MIAVPALLGTPAFVNSTTVTNRLQLQSRQGLLRPCPDLVLLVLFAGHPACDTPCGCFVGWHVSHIAQSEKDALHGTLCV